MPTDIEASGLGSADLRWTFLELGPRVWCSQRDSVWSGPIPVYRWSCEVSGSSVVSRRRGRARIPVWGWSAGYPKPGWTRRCRRSGTWGPAWTRCCCRRGPGTCRPATRPLLSSRFLGAVPRPPFCEPRSADRIRLDQFLTLWHSDSDRPERFSAEDRTAGPSWFVFSSSPRHLKVSPITSRSALYKWSALCLISSDPIR